MHMTTFSREEIVPSTKVSRNLSSLLNKLKNHQIEKVAVVRNNEMEAIIITVQEYELMQALLEKDEYRNIVSSIKERDSTPTGNYIDFNAILSELKIDYETL
jgi:PHD/YefM family antitoxin component YafN of YafNO toxin-antitoxin module